MDTENATPPVNSRNWGILGRAWRRMDERYPGWRMGIFGASIAVAIALIINITWTIVTATKYSIEHGIGTLFVGSCDTVKHLNTGVHIVINVLSTFILGGGHYALQCLFSPTRDEVDQAHRSQRWVDIGIPSIRNVRRVSQWRKLLGGVILLSSVPIHLLYNSTIFSSISANEYRVLLVAENILEKNSIYNFLEEYDKTSNDTLNRLMLKDMESWEKLTPEDCIKAYDQDFLTKHRNLVIFSNHTNTKMPLIAGWDVRYDVGKQLSQNWICRPPAYDSTGCNIPGILERMKKNGSAWNVTYGSYANSPMSFLNSSIVTKDALETQPVKECRAETSHAQHCKLLFSEGLLITVILFNTITLVSLIALLRWKDFRPLVTLGDAVDSFMRRPDQSTAGMCTAEQRDFGWIWPRKLKGLKAPSPASVEGRWAMGRQKNDRLVNRLKDLNDRRATQLDPASHHRQWLFSASPARWILCLILWLIALTVLSTSYSNGYAQDGGYQSTDFKAMWSRGFGTVDGLSLFEQGRDLGFTAATLRSNSPQLILSALYYLYNGIFTCMLMGAEWNTFAARRKPLRVSTRKGQQRSTYWLQLPYVESIPLLLLSALLHWLCSQAIFLAHIEITGSGETDKDLGNSDLLSATASPIISTVATVGYSCIALLSMISVCSFALVLCMCFGFRRYTGNIPLVGSCSAAIAAACHPVGGDVDPGTTEEPLQWGVVTEANGIGHLSFSKGEVGEPVPGILYS